MLVQPWRHTTRAQPEEGGRNRQRAMACGRRGPAPPRHPHARINGYFQSVWNPSMDIEQVNAIGSLLADLSARTEQLRGYL